MTIPGQSGCRRNCNEKYSAISSATELLCPVDCGCKIHRLLLFRGVPPNESPGYDTKQSDSEVPVMLELWWMWSTPSLLSLLGLLWLGGVAPVRTLYTYAELKCLRCSCYWHWYWIVRGGNVLTLKLCTYAKLNCLKLNCFEILLNCFDI